MSDAESIDFAELSFGSNERIDFANHPVRQPAPMQAAPMQVDEVGQSSPTRPTPEPSAPSSSSSAPMQGAPMQVDEMRQSSPTRPASPVQSAHPTSATSHPVKALVQFLEHLQDELYDLVCCELPDRLPATSLKCPPLPDNTTAGGLRNARMAARRADDRGNALVSKVLELSEAAIFALEERIVATRYLRAYEEEEERRLADRDEAVEEKYQEQEARHQARMRKLEERRRKAEERLSRRRFIDDEAAEDEDERKED